MLIKYYELSPNLDINVKDIINGWTPLHTLISEFKGKDE